MLITVGVVITSALIVMSVVALADIIENDALPAAMNRAWLIGVILAPGIGAALWFAHRPQFSHATGGAPSRTPLLHDPSRRDLERLLEEIDQFLSSKG